MLRDRRPRPRARRFCISRELLATASVPWDFWSHRQKDGAELLATASVLWDFGPIDRRTALRMYENAPTFTHLEHCHCRFRRRIFYIPLQMCGILTFHNQISSSSSHSFRNPLYETHLLSLSICFKYAKKPTYRVIAMYFKAVREYFSSPVITHKPSSLGIPPEAGIDLMGPTECSREVRSHVSHHRQRELGP